MAVVPGVTGANCTLTIGADEHTMWVTSLSTSGDRGTTKTPTWGVDNGMVHAASADYTADLAGVFNPEGGLNTVLEEAMRDETEITLVVEYGAFERTFTAWKVSSYSDEAPADGLVTFTATITGPTMWTSVPAVAGP
jgi:hypothetical protein